MKIHKRFIGLAVLGAGILQGGNIAQLDLRSAAPLPKGWMCEARGDGSEIRQALPGSGLLLGCRSNRNWVFLMRTLAPEELPPGEQLRITATVASNSPYHLLAVGCGDAVTRVALPEASPEKWQRLQALVSPGQGESVWIALGFDPEYPGYYAMVRDLTVESSEKGVFAPLLPLPSESVPELPPELAACFPDTAEAYQAGFVNPLADIRHDMEIPATADTMLRWMQLREAREVVPLLVRNRTAEAQSFLVTLTGELAQVAQWRKLVWIKGMADLPMPQAQTMLLEVAPHQTEALELLFDTHDIPAGTYRGTVKIAPDQGRFPETEFAVELEVLSEALPETLPVAFFVWDGDRSNDPAERAFLMDAKVNVFHIPLGEADRDFSEDIEVLLEEREAGSFQLLVEDWHIRGQVHAFGADEAAWLDRIIGRMEAHGLGYSDWMLHLYDETLSPEFLAVAQAVKAHNPQVRLFADHQSDDPKLLGQFLEVIDVWCPLSNIFPEVKGDSGHEMYLQALREAKKTRWTYNCGWIQGDYTPRHYRILSWLVWKYGFDGISFFTARSASLRSAGTGGEGSDFMLNYTVAGEKFAGRRFQQVLGGLADYQLLELAAKNPANRKRVEELVDQVVSGSAADWLSARRQLLNMVMGTDEKK